MTAGPETRTGRPDHQDDPPPQPHARTTRPLKDSAAGCQHPPVLRPHAHQIAPVGPVPDTDTVFVGAVLYADPSVVTDVLAVVQNDDLENPSLAAVVAAIRSLTAAGKPYGPQLVLDELRRHGQAKGAVLEAFQRTWTTGAAPEAARDYGAAVVANRLRRLVESAGHALTAAAADAAEIDIARIVERSTSAIRDCNDRLTQLRTAPIHRLRSTP